MKTQVLLHMVTRKLFVNINAESADEATLLQALAEQGHDLTIDGTALTMGTSGGWICICTKGTEISKLTLEQLGLEPKP